MRLRVAPIVEGHGEVYSIRTLVTRVWLELLGGEYVDVEAIHEAYVAADEKGTEAAAATAVAMRAGAAFAGPPVEFRADHPFVFVIRDLTSGAVLFMGRVGDPTA